VLTLRPAVSPIRCVLQATDTSLVRDQEPLLRQSAKRKRFTRLH